MEKVVISNEAYEEFKSFLDENKVESYNIRINHVGNSCGGPVLNISVDEATENDFVEKVNDLTFIIDKRIINEFGLLTILSKEENDGRGIALRPLMEPEGGCDSCGGGCH